MQICLTPEEHEQQQGNKPWTMYDAQMRTHEHMRGWNNYNK